MKQGQHRQQTVANIIDLHYHTIPEQCFLNHYQVGKMLSLFRVLNLNLHLTRFNSHYKDFININQYHFDLREDVQVLGEHMRQTIVGKTVMPDYMGNITFGTNAKNQQTGCLDT